MDGFCFGCGENGFLSQKGHSETCGQILRLDFSVSNISGCFWLQNQWQQGYGICCQNTKKFCTPSALFFVEISFAHANTIQD